MWANLKKTNPAHMERNFREPNTAKHDKIKVLENAKASEVEAYMRQNSGMVDLFAKPRAGHRRDGSVRSANHWL
jgi:hypothetical protein